MKQTGDANPDDQLYREYQESTQEASAAAFRKIEAQSVGNAIAADIFRAGRKARRVALVLGAGVSYECGIPMWIELVDKLLVASTPADLRKQIRKARLTEARKMRLLELHTKHYRAALQRILYQSATVPRKSTLAHVAHLVADLYQQRALDRVITYNFDGLLQEELANHFAGVRFKTISLANQYVLEPNRVHIMHPHGYLGRNFSLDEALTAALVFSEPSYHAHFLDNLFWANRAQLAAFSEMSCLFIGMSFSDPNHRRLLDATKRNVHPQHVAIMRWDSENPIANVLVRNDLLSLGVRPYWIKSFSEIGAALRKLRN